MIEINRRSSAFTLIELLIVVAIIGILAAIAIPNFLEAQTRAKVARAKADMRTLAIGTETYRVDENAYPFPSDEDGNHQTSAATEWPETRTSVSLTTPIAHLGSRLNEPFSAAKGTENPQFHYATRDYVVLGEGDAEEYDEYVEEMLGDHKRVYYFYLSHGPDLDHDFEHHHDHTADSTTATLQEEEGSALYDPTNGTISSGDIVYWGGLGLRN